MNKHLSAILIAGLIVSGCSGTASWSSLNPFSEAKETVKEESEPQQVLGVNPYLWQAALAKLSFMPLASVDAVGGVIVTDWAAMDGIPDEQFKITVNILSQNLRADCLKVAVFKRVLQNGTWVNETADKRLAGEIEQAILTQARRLYRRDLAARD